MKALLRALFVSVFVSVSLLCMSQNLSKHQWKNRLLLVISDDKENTMWQTQLNMAAENETGCKDRKLLIYCVQPEMFTVGISEKKWTRGNKLYDRFPPGATGFRLVLIGLDGSVKEDSPTGMPMQRLFNKIDRMPMRRRELRNERD